MRRAHRAAATLATALPVLCLLLLSWCCLSFSAAAADPARGPTSIPEQQQQPPPSLRAGPAPDAQAHRQPAPNNANDGSNSSFDYIVVGAGNTGTVVAVRCVVEMNGMIDRWGW